uniref:Uncharacterized protein n=1 Tax=Arundo donax TaxID=35708 RepID=A0A0A9HDR8_ARUDO
MPKLPRQFQSSIGRMMMREEAKDGENLCLFGIRPRRLPVR